MHFIQVVGVAITVVAAASATPIAGSSGRPQSWCSTWDSDKGCCEDQGKYGCTRWSTKDGRCQTWLPGYGNEHSWCGNWDSGKGCCEDQGKQGCTQWDSHKNQCQSWQQGKGHSKGHGKDHVNEHD